MGLRGGIDLGGTKIQAAVLDDAHAVRGSARVPTPTGGGPSAVVESMREALEQACADAGVQLAELAGAGVGAPGAIHGEELSTPPNLPGWGESFPLGSALREALGIEVALGNDVQVATSAEFELGAARPFTSLLGVFWGTGVGGGVVLDGRPWTGRGGAGEIGHMVVKLDGARCMCGRRGCMEAYAGRAAMEARARRLHEEKGHKTDLFELMRERGRTRLTSGVWARALHHGDKLATELIERAIAALGAGVASAVNLLDVECVVIGGGLGVRLGEPYAARIAEAMRPHLFSDARPPEVLLAELGDLGGAIGAALLLEHANSAERAAAGPQAS